MPRRELTTGPLRPTAGDEIETDVLAARWQNEGDAEARDALIERYLPMARRLARRYQSRHEPVDDLFQVACLGLVAAIDRFDPGRGTSFPSFAIPTILGELKRHFRNTGWAVHLPRGAQEMAMRLERASREIFEKWGREPTVTELAQYLETTPEAVLDGLEAGSGHYASSLDEPIGRAEAEEPLSVIDTIGRDEEGYGVVEATSALTDAITRLPYLERRALTLRLSHSMKQKDIARELGCSQMQVSRLLRRAGTTLSAAIHPRVADRRRHPAISSAPSG
jgi:RNA polymerase sigma-B factor